MYGIILLRVLFRGDAMTLDELDRQVSECTLCNSLVEKFPASKTVFLGKNNKFVLIGEAPANNGWRKSNMLWRDVTGKFLPSAVVMQKLLDVIDCNLLDVTFLEAVKCYPINRNNLKVCSKNCKSIIMQQIEILNPELIITLGEFPTRNLLGNDFKKFSEVVGKFHNLGKYKVLSIYHPSPVSPMSYKGNLPIFEMLKEKKYENK